MRVLLSLVVCGFLLVMWGSAMRYTPFGPPVRELTRPIERSLGIHQTWPMFGSPPRTTVWLEPKGILDDGERIRLEPLHPIPDPNGVIRRYHRRHKFTRNAVAEKRDYLRAAMVRRYCREAKASGVDLRKIQMDRVTLVTPPPYSEYTPRSTWRAEVKTLETWNCRR